MSAVFGLGEEIKAAVLTVDVLRGHLDPEYATLPLAADAAAEVVEANVRFLRKARSAGIPVVHGVTIHVNSREIQSNPFWSSLAGGSNSRRDVLNHVLKGSVGTEFMPGIFEDGDHVVDAKHRYSCFYETDLDFLLRHEGINTLLITGVNTNSCVLATTVDAQMRDYAAIVVRDCVDTMDPELHGPALQCIENAFGWVMESGRALESVSAEAAARV